MNLRLRLRGAAGSETAFTAAGNALVLVGNIATGVISARFLGAQKRGEFLTVYTWAGVVGLFLNGAAFHALVSYAKRGLPTSRIRWFVAQHLLLTAAGASVIGWVALAATGVSWLTPAHVIGGALFTVATVSGADMAGIAIGYGDLRRGLQEVRLAPIITSLAAMVALTLAGDRSPGHWLIVAGAARLAPNLVWLKMLAANPSPPEPGADQIRFSTVARTAGRLYLAGLAAQVNYRLDLLAVSVLLDRAAVANYGVAAAAATAVASIGQAVGMVSFGEISSPGARSTAVATARKGARQAAIFSSAIAIPVAIASPVLVGLLYGPQYHAAVVPTIILVLAAVPLSIEFLLIHHFIGVPDALRPLYLTLGITSLLTVVGVSVLTVLTRSLTAVALVSPVVYTASMLLLLRFSRHLGVDGS
ncbi:MAG: lipopolysaccharide biosynthesis protein [Acidimicrobiales bacterium]